MRRVVITGLGAITPLGVGVQKSWERLVLGKSGIVSLRDREEFKDIPSQVAACVPVGKKFDGGWTAKEWLATGDDRRMATFTQYAVAASQEALEDAGLKFMSDQDRMRTGVCVGSGIGSFEDAHYNSLKFADHGYRKVAPTFVPRLLINMAAGHITMKNRFRGPNHSVSTACATGGHSIGDASRFIQFGDADIMLAGGSESCIHPVAMAGFSRARSLATEFNDRPQAASRPFDMNRDGFVMGEGAGILVLESLEHAKARGAKIYAEITGYGTSSDAHHMTAPPEDGSGAFLAMKMALKNAKTKPMDVDYVNAHATSTALGDAAENRAVRRLLLGQNGYASPKSINMSSNKGQIGHLLGAAGAVEAIFTIKSLEEGILPPTANLRTPGEKKQKGDPKEEFDCNYVPLVAQTKKIKVALSNSFGFGGTNTSLCFEKFTK